MGAWAAVWIIGIPSICGLHQETVGSWHVSIWYLKNRSSCGTNIGQKLPPARVADILQGTLRPPYCHTAKSLLLGTGSWLSVWWKKTPPASNCMWKVWQNISRGIYWLALGALVALAPYMMYIVVLNRLRMWASSPFPIRLIPEFQHSQWLHMNTDDYHT